MDAEEQELLRRTIVGSIGGAAGGDDVETLLGLGWPDAYAADSRVAISVLFEHIGSALSAINPLELAIETALGLPPGTHRLLLPLPGPSEFVLLSDVPAPVIVPPLPGGNGMVRILAWSDAADSLIPLKGLDSSLHLSRVRLPDHLGGTEVATTESWGVALACGQRALAHTLTGLARRMLTTTRTYVLDRHQFGRPIGSFQSVKHKLADVLVAIEAAEAALEIAWDDDAPMASALARSLAAEAAQLAGNVGQQVQGAMAFTWEYGFHHSVRRSMVLSRLLGSADETARELGDLMLREQLVPRFG